MKHKTIALLLIMLVALLLFSGCQIAAKLDAAEDAVENKLDAIEDTAEQQLAPTAPIPAAEPPVPTEAAPDTTQPVSTKITEAEAQAIALEHAGLTADQVTRLQVEYSLDDLRPEYEVEFYYDQQEYSYELHAETGEILSFDGPDIVQPAAQAAQELTAAEAEAIALEHAGFTADQVKFLHSEYEIDDGIPQFEIEFDHEVREYSYTIHAETGEILSFEQDD